MILRFKKIIAIFLLISIVGIAAPNQEPAEADLITGIFGLFFKLLGLVCDIIGFIPGAGLLIGDFCDVIEDLQRESEKVPLKYPQPMVSIKFLDDFDGGINGEEAKPMVRAVAEPQGFKLDSDGYENLYVTWSINDDYKYNAYLAGGEIENRWGTLVKDGDVYKREGGEGYDKWKAKYGVGSGGDDSDDDGFSAPYGGPNGKGDKCAQMLRDQGEVSPYSSCGDLEHEFSKIVASCPDGTTGTVGDGTYNACEEFTWGTDPTKASTSGANDINDEMKMAGVGGKNFAYFVSDVDDFNPKVTVYVEGTTVRPVEEQNAYFYIMKVQNTKYPYEDDDYLNVDIEITPDRPQANGSFKATANFVKQEPTDRDVLNFRWRFWRKDEDPNDDTNLQEGYGLDQVMYPGADFAALTEGVYYVELQVCNIENDTRVCGKFKRKQINIGGESALTIEAMLVNEQGLTGNYVPVALLLHNDIIRVTAECFIDPNLDDPELGCDGTGYSYVWDISVGSVESGRKIVSGWDGEQLIDASVQPTDLSLLNVPSIVFKVPADTTSLTIVVDGVGKNNQDLKIDEVTLGIAEPTIDLVINKGGQKDQGRTDRGVVYAGQDVELGAILGPPGTSFEALGNDGSVSYEWLEGTSYESTNIYEFTANDVEKTNHVISASAYSIGNPEQLSESNRLVLEVQGSAVEGAFSWKKVPQYFYDKFKNLTGGYMMWTIIALLFVVPMAYSIGGRFRKKKLVRNK